MVKTSESKTQHTEERNVWGVVFLLILVIVAIIGLIWFVTWIDSSTVFPWNNPVESTQLQVSPSPSSESELKENNPDVGLQNIDGVPIDWPKVEIPDLGISFRKPKSATVENVDGNDRVFRLTADSLSMVFTSEVDIDQSLHQEALSLKEKVANDKEYEDVQRSQIAGYDTYYFTATDNKSSYVLLEIDEANYLQVRIDAAVDQDWQVAEDILASLEKESS